MKQITTFIYGEEMEEQWRLLLKGHQVQQEKLWKLIQVFGLQSLDFVAVMVGDRTQRKRKIKNPLKSKVFKEQEVVLH